MASGETNDPMINWIIYEDLGSLVHCNNADEMIRAAGVIQEWHRIPVQKVPEGWIGHSPDYAQVLKILSADTVRMNSTLEATGISHSMVLSWWAQLPNWERFIQEKLCCIPW